MSKYVVVTLPQAHWDQIVSDIENMCGADAEEIEILSDVVVRPLRYPNFDPEGSEGLTYG